MVRLFLSIIFLLCLWTSEVGAFDSDFPVWAGESGTVQCLKKPDIEYDIYLPSSYSSGRMFPVLYTFTTGKRGGMVDAFKDMADEFQMIIVGIIGAQHRAFSNKNIIEIMSVFEDISNRVKIDPSRQLVAGFSDGGIIAYNVARRFPSKISGIIAMAGSLDKRYGKQAMFNPGLYVARSTGTNDRQSKLNLKKDLEYLTESEATVEDFSFNGGHVIAPDILKYKMLDWLLTQIPATKTSAMRKAVKQRKKWRKNMRSKKRGTKLAIFQSCVFNATANPKSPISEEAKKIMLVFMSDYKKFAKLKFQRMNGRGKLDAFFGHMAYKWGLYGNRDIFYSSLKCLKLIPAVDPNWFVDISLLMLFAPDKSIVSPKAAEKLLEKQCMKYREKHELEMLLAAAQFQNGKRKKAAYHVKKLNEVKLSVKYIAAFNDLKQALDSPDGVLHAKIWLDILQNIGR